MRVVAFFRLLQTDASIGELGARGIDPFEGVGRESLAIASGCASQGDRSKIKATGRCVRPAN